MILTILLIIIALILLESVYSNLTKPLKGPFLYPILHNLPQGLWFFSRYYYWLEDLQKQYGKTFVISQLIGEPNYVITSDVANVEYILKTNFENYEKGPLITDSMSDVLGKGIFVVNGSDWYSQRKIASNLFKKRLLKSFVPVYHKHIQGLTKVLSKNVNKELDVQQLLNSFTLETFCDVAFSHDLDCLEKPSSFQTSFDKLNEIMISRFFNPLWKTIDLFGMEKLVKENLSNCDKVVYGIIDRRIELLKSEKTEFQDILSYFMNAKDEKGNSLDRKYIRDIIINLLLAGKDTTGQTLTWALHFLSQNSECEEKLREEVKKISEGKTITLEMVEQMTYLKAVINETLRLAPPVSLDDKTAIKDDILPDGTKIKKGTIVCWIAWNLGRHPDYFGDPLKFKPERWFSREANGGVEVPSDKSTVPPFVPFQMGPRICLGQKFALDELQITIASLISQFTFLPTKRSQNVVAKVGITLSAANGMWLIPKRL